MKKLLFSALVLAFSGVSIANNHPDSKIKESSDKQNIVIFFTGCENWAMDQMAINDPQDQMSPSDAHDEYRSLVELCDSH